MNLDTIIEASTGDAYEANGAWHMWEEDQGVLFELPLTIKQQAEALADKIDAEILKTFNAPMPSRTQRAAAINELRLCCVIRVDGPAPVKCECGSAACGSGAHSDWCPAR